jgi:hypothetical protein
VSTLFKPRRFLRPFPMMVPGLMLAACAINPADAQSSTPARMVEVHHACAQTMGLNPANADYDMCVASLLQTLSGMDQASLVERDRQVCARRGLQPGSRDFAVCVVDAETPISN